jgi:hypothetical protein
VYKFAPKDVKFILLTCHPAKRARAPLPLRRSGAAASLAGHVQQMTRRRERRRERRSDDVPVPLLRQRRIWVAEAGAPGTRKWRRRWEHPVPEVEQDRVDPRGVHTMIAQSMYAYGVQRWLDVGFKLEQFMLVTQEDLASDPAGLSGPPGAF